MDITLQEIYLTTGSIAFVLISVFIVGIFIFMYKMNNKINELVEKTNEFYEQTVKTKYALQLGIVKMVMTLIGGDRNHE